MALALDPAAVLADLDELAAQSGGRFAGAKRLAWTPDWKAACEWLIAKLSAAGLDSWRDAAGNIWAEIPGERDDFVIVGSHIDAVPDGGWLDGALGVTAALEVMRQLARAGTKAPCGVRFVNWADEEGARFGRSLVGSSAAAGTLEPAEVASLKDANDITLLDALADAGVVLEAASEATASLNGALAYLELHIEQGPVLLESGRLAAAVSGTFGVERHLITYTGQAAHAGSTPMHLRQDSLAAAARSLLGIRDSAIARGGVATVGRAQSTPGVITAIAGVTEMQLDQRHLDADALALMLADALEICEAAAREFGCSLEVRRVFNATPTVFDPELVAIVRASIAACGGGDHDPVPSGPLHDATEVGRLVPTAMIFAQSDPPLSHARIEDSPKEALEIAISAYGHAVQWVIQSR